MSKISYNSSMSKNNKTSENKKVTKNNTGVTKKQNGSKTVKVKRKNKPRILPINSTCIVCKETKPTNNFVVAKSTKRVNSRCKSCTNKAARLFDSKKKQCTMCNAIKPFSEFALISGGPRMNSYCKDCGRGLCRSYKARNKEKIAKYNKKYKADPVNKITICKYNHDYSLENRKEIQTRHTAYLANKRKNDPNYKATVDLRLNLWIFWKDKYCENFRKILGCSYIFFKKWIIFQFDENMSLDNYGTYWHFDHVNPCKNFNLTILKNQMKCFHWSNTRPFEKIENKKRSDDTDPKEINKHECVIISYLVYLQENNILQGENYTIL